MGHTSAVALLLAAAVACDGGAPPPPAMPTMLFMSPVDVVRPWGLIQPRAQPVVRCANLSSPPVDTPLAAFNVLRGNEPTGEIEAYGLHNGKAGGLVRYTTTDFKTWSQAVVLDLLAAAGKHCCEGKSIARDDATYTYVFLAWQAGYGGHSFVSRNGLNWTKTAAQIKAHDDANIIFTNGRFVDMQILKQKYEKRYCDNAGCDARRVISAITSLNGLSWSAVNNSNVRVPDELDPPELEFYRIRPFLLSGSTRLMAHVLHYAPSPEVLKLVSHNRYGMNPTICHKGNATQCHGPHIYDEWWVLPRNADAADVQQWHRPFRNTRAGPRDVPLMAPPVLSPAFPGQHIFLDNHSVYTVPQFRIGGLYAPANAEFSTQSFPGSAVAGLWINVNAKWVMTGKDMTHGFGCDEGCAAYVMAELSAAGNPTDPLPGFERENCVMMDVDGARLPLRWHAPNTSVALQLPPSVDSVVLRLFFRDATIHAVGSGSTAAHIDAFRVES